jgi:RNA polymerase sigma-70 factor (ECF subfamily)
MSTPDAAAEFSRTWETDSPRVAAYARRHVAADDVPDVVAETFLQAWRRWDAVPRPPIAWLLGTARKVMGNHRRAAGRRAALHDRLVLLDTAARTAADAGLLAAERLEALAALATLPEHLREAILLTSWDGLTPDEAATALGIRPGTLRVRVHRARKALDDAATSSRDASAPVTPVTPVTPLTPLTPLTPAPEGGTR